MMDFSLFHAALPRDFIEKVQDLIKRLLGISEHVGECPPLPIAKKLRRVTRTYGPWAMSLR